MDSFELSQERLHMRQMQFLKSATPDDWHRYAWHHNWDNRLDGLYWIVSQPECDKASALLIYWKGEPTGYDYETDEETMGNDIYAVSPMLRYISERFNTIGYTRSEIAYDFLEDHGANMPEFYAMIEAGRKRDIEELIERQKDLAEPHTNLHPSMRLLKISGRKVGGYKENSDFYEQFPDDVIDEDAAPSVTTTTSVQYSKSSSNGEPLANASVEAYNRIRAIRHQSSEQFEATSNSRNADRSADAFHNLNKRKIAADMKDALTEAVWLFANLACLGFAAAFAPKFLFSNNASNLFWGAAIVALAICLYNSASGLRALQLAVLERGLQLSSVWTKITAIIAVFAGIAIGWRYAAHFLDTTVTPFMRYSSLVSIGAAMQVLSYALARILIHPRAVR